MTALLLVNPPWPRPEHLSIQTATLAGALRKSPHSVIQRNYAPAIRSFIGTVAYEGVVQNDLQQYEAATLLFPNYAERYRQLFRRVLPHVEFDDYIAHCDGYYRAAAHDILALSPDLVGFTTTFLQFLPSVYIATLIKRQSSAKVVLGGAVLSDEYGSIALEHFPSLDYIVYGEGEQTLLQLCDWVGGNATTLSDVDGLVYRAGDRKVIVNRPRAQLHDLDQLAEPDFSGQRQWRLNPEDQEHFLPTIPLEAARGCFYGKCSFCNLNEQWGNTYRRKSDQKVLRELRHAVQDQQSFRIMMCDTDVSNRQDLFERIRNEGLDLDLILEVSGHRDGREEAFFQTLQEAGATQIQIGIESFAPRLLRLMQKGVNVMKNVEMLKWCATYGIRVFYNLISMVPGECQEDVSDTVTAMKELWTFEPPARICPFVLAHDSPAGKSPSRFGVAGITLPAEIRYCYPEDWMHKLAPLFTPIVGHDPVPTRPFADWREVERIAEDWQQEYQARACSPGMTYRDVGPFLSITVNRSGVVQYINLSSIHRAVFKSIDRAAHTVREVAAATGIAPDTVEHVLREFAKNGLVFRHGTKSLALPISRSRLHNRDPLRNVFAANV